MVTFSHILSIGILSVVICIHLNTQNLERCSNALYIALKGCYKDVQMRYIYIFLKCCYTGVRLILDLKV